MSLGKNIRFFRKQKRLTQTELGSLVGFSVPYISEIEKGNHKKTPHETVKKFAVALGVNYIELYEQSHNSALKFKGLQKFAPLIKWNEVEVWLSHGENMEQEREIEYFPISSALKDNCFFVEITNDAMQSSEALTFNIGDSVLVEPCSDAENGKFIICKLKNDNEPILRQFFKEGGKVRLTPLNKQIKTEYITDFNPIEILGVVIERRVPMV